ncbi:BQ5605_C039g11760 [Microbotryum silenes-dioicae]|uniref:BQ5605_C039g11760 protein n=1 Tax=Microbotryum silenes-dioicae TaxID=796604 RepID=A0A2X0N1B9_9BASI|nr:BQ5605_C039g11760 [Microbotryum silenes-dioicae]
MGRRGFDRRFPRALDRSWCGPAVLVPLVSTDKSGQGKTLLANCLVFCPEWITGNKNLHTSNWLHFCWVFIPLWIMHDSYGYIVHSLRDPAGYAAELTRGMRPSPS